MASPAIIKTAAKSDDEEKSPEEIIRKYKILDEKCDETLKRIKRRKKINSK